MRNVMNEDIVTIAWKNDGTFQDLVVFMVRHICAHSWTALFRAFSYYYHCVKYACKPSSLIGLKKNIMKSLLVV